jgi:hypothetical protein
MLAFRHRWYWLPNSVPVLVMPSASLSGSGAGFLAAGLAEAFFAAGISYPPFHSAVAEDKKLSFQFA